MRNVDQRFFTIQYRRSSTDDTSRADDPSRKLVDGVPADRPLPIPRDSPPRDGKHPATAAADEHHAIPFPSAANRGASRSSATGLQRAQSSHLRSPPDLRGAGGIWLNPIPTHPQLTSAVSYDWQDSTIALNSLTAAVRENTQGGWQSLALPPHVTKRLSGEAGIRTLGRVTPSPVFKTGAIGRSATSPGCGGGYAAAISPATCSTSSCRPTSRSSGCLRPR